MISEVSYDAAMHLDRPLNYLLDDITHCVLSEVTGRVVLGTRRGQLMVL